MSWIAVIYSIAFWISSRLLNRVYETAQRDRESLRESEEQDRLLFSSMEEGFCTIELKFSETNVPMDYRFLEVNPVFESQTGLKDAKGKWMRECSACSLASHISSSPFDRFRFDERPTPAGRRPSGPRDDEAQY